MRHFACGLNNKNRLKRQNNFAIYNIVRLVRRDERRFDSPPRLTQKQNESVSGISHHAKGFQIQIISNKSTS